MFSIEIKDENGKVLSGSQLQKHLEDSFDGQVKELLKEKGAELAEQLDLRDVTCSVHKSVATNWRVEPIPDSEYYGLGYDECCEVLVDAINEKFE